MTTSAEPLAPGAGFSEPRGLFDPKRYVVSPGFDWLFFIGSPLIAVAVVLGARSVLPDGQISYYVLAYMAVGHHVPTFIRAYLDPSEFRRNRFELLVIPLLVVPLVFLCTATLPALIALTFIWDQYHFVRQQYGFMRVYDAKAGAEPKKRAWNLDQLLCFSLLVCIISWSDLYSFTYTGGFFDLGVDIPAWFGPVARIGSLSAALVVGVLFVADLGRRISRGLPVSAQKLAVTATTFGVWYYAYVVIGDLFVSYAIASFAHCFQYDAFAWFYNHKKASTMQPDRSNAIFRYVHSSKRIWLYIAAIFAYGQFSSFFRLVDPLFILALNRSTGFLHYYFDSFIWRVRRDEFRAHL